MNAGLMRRTVRRPAAFIKSQNRYVSDPGHYSRAAQMLQVGTVSAIRRFDDFASGPASTIGRTITGHWSLPCGFVAAGL